MRKYALVIAFVALIALVGCREHECIWTEVGYTEPTCTSEGRIDYECQTCKATRFETIPALGHDYGSWETTDPTCTEDGFRKHVCKVCGNIETEKMVPALGHKYDVSVWPAAEWKNSDDLTTNSRECSVCHEVETRDGIVVNPTNVQALINSVNTGKVYFSAGEYGDFMIWHGKKVSKVTEHGETTEIDKENLQDTKSYDYHRTIENMELIGEEGAVFTGKISCNTGHVHGDATEYAKPIMDPIREGHKIVDCNYGFYSFITINGITFSNMKFSDGWIYISFEMSTTSITNMLVSDCEFTGSSSSYDGDSKKPAIRIGTDLNEDVFNNIVVKNTTISNYYQGVYVQNPKGMVVEGCTIDTTKHNAIAVQSATDEKGNVLTTFGGRIEIKNNNVSNTGDRAIRFNNGKGAKIVIECNIFVDAADKDGQLLKTGTLTDCKYTLKGNTYNGDSIADVVEGSETPWIVTIPSTPTT